MRLRAVIASLLIAALGPGPVMARIPFEGLDQTGTPRTGDAPGFGLGRVVPFAIPDRFGPGAVLTVGNLQMKIINNGIVGNPYQPTTSQDPSGQWPGASAVEYLNAIALAVGAVNPNATDPTAARRVSFATEWRPATLDPEDKLYRAYDGIVNGSRFVNDDNDRDILTNEPKIDEDFLDGRDNDGDGLIDEDHAALGQAMFSCVMRDDTPQAINTVFNEKHVPLGLECRQKAWAYSIQGFQDFNVVEYQIINRSGHTLDSLVIGWLVDMDCGPLSESNYFQDDFDLPKFPQGEFTVVVDGGGRYDLPDRERRQLPHDPLLDGVVGGRDSALCPRVTLRINGFSLADDNGDDGRTRGTPAFLLIDHTIDPLGNSGPSRVGFKAFRSFTSSTPYQQGGNPVIDQQRFEFMVGASEPNNIDPETGFISAEPGETKGDYVQWCSIGPWRNVPDGGSVSATIAFAVKDGSFALNKGYTQDYERYLAGTMAGSELLDKYPLAATAWTAQIAFEGIHERREGFPATDYHGRETGLRAKRGEPVYFVVDCTSADRPDPFPPEGRPVTDRDYTWFDLDCDYCTGVWNYTDGSGSNPRAGARFHKTWNAAAPPPSPSLNTSASFNYTDNPERKLAYAPSRDHGILLAWDNLSEITPDPKSEFFDFRGYKIWKVSDWTRPVGSPGPSENDWKLLAEFRMFDYEKDGVPIADNRVVVAGDTVCPTVFIPNWKDPTTGIRGPANVPICLERGDLWDRQSGEIIHPDRTLGCVRNPDNPDSCVTVTGCMLGRQPCSLPQNQQRRTKYPIGRYTYLDREVKNGFTYFYSVTATDSVRESGQVTESSGRRSAVESEGVAPQVSTGTGKGVWVVPNPYRGYARLSDRPSAWDLTPNATDPTGTHLDFMGLPAGEWTIKIFTVAGDLVAELHSSDAVNESLRAPIKGAGGISRPGYNRQRDAPNDGEASWNLISRNGQDVVSGIYLFVVESGAGTQRGRFVVVR